MHVQVFYLDTKTFNRIYLYTYNELTSSPDPNSVNTPFSSAEL